MRLSHGSGGHGGAGSASFDVVGASTVTSVQVLQSMPLENAASAAKLMAQFLMSSEQEKAMSSTSSSLAFSYQLDDLWQVAESMAMTTTTTKTANISDCNNPILTEIRKMRRQQQQHGKSINNNNDNDEDSFQDKGEVDIANHVPINHNNDNTSNDSPSSSSDGKKRKRSKEEKEEKRAAKKAKKKERKLAKKEQQRQSSSS